MPVLFASLPARSPVVGEPPSLPECSATASLAAAGLPFMPLITRPSFDSRAST